MSFWPDFGLNPGIGRGATDSALTKRRKKEYLYKRRI